LIALFQGQAMKRYIIFALITTAAAFAQNITTEYDKYMYRGHVWVWWNQVSEGTAIPLAEDSEQENAHAGGASELFDFSVNEIPLPYFFDKLWKRNWNASHKSKIIPMIEHFSPSRLTDELGKPTTISFSKTDWGYGKIGHNMEYHWLNKTTDKKQYVVLNGVPREVVGVHAFLKKVNGDWSKNNMITAKRSSWVVNIATLNLAKPMHCSLNICNPAFKCPGHDISPAAKNKIRAAQSVEEEELLKMGYKNLMDSRFAKAKSLRERHLGESKWYLERASQVRHQDPIIKVVSKK